MKSVLKKVLLAVLICLPTTQAFAVEVMACSQGEVLICIPAPPCGNGSIGCREAPRPAPTCFCVKPVKTINMDISIEENEASDY